MAEQQARELTRVGSYEILGKLGEGKMTVVYQARDVRDGKTVALKIMRPEWTQSVAFLKRFEREADAAESFDHPYLAKAYEHGEAEGYHFCALELIEGEPLSDKLKRGETLTEAQALYVTRCIAEGLQYAWTRGIIHRDIKPGNIMIQTDSRIRLIDMGLAKSFNTGETTVTQAGAALGSAAYASPEQLEGKTDVDIRGDIYSLGLTLFHLTCGRQPFEGESDAVVAVQNLSDPLPDPKMVNPKLSSAFSTFVRKLAEKKPEKRYQTPAEVLVAIEKVFRGEETGRYTPISIQPKRAAHRGHARGQGLPAGKRKTSMLPLTAGAVSLVVAAVLVILFWPDGKKAGPVQKNQVETEKNASSKTDPDVAKVIDSLKQQKEKAEAAEAKKPVPKSVPPIETADGPPIETADGPPADVNPAISDDVEIEERPAAKEREDQAPDFTEKTPVVASVEKPQIEEVTREEPEEVIQPVEPAIEETVKRIEVVKKEYPRKKAYPYNKGKPVMRDHRRDIQFLLKGVKTVFPTGNNRPGIVAVFGTSTFPVIASSTSGSSFRPAPVMAGAKAGKGRIIAFAHDGYLKRKPFKDTPRLLSNAIKWLAPRSKAPRVGVLNIAQLVGTLEDEKINVVELTEESWLDELPKVHVFCSKNYDFKLKELEVLKRYISRGGALMIGVTPWRYLRDNEGNLHEHFPINRLMASAGLYFTSAMGRISEAGYEAAPPDTLTHTGEAIRQLIDHANGIKPLDKDSERIARRVADIAGRDIRFDISSVIEGYLEWKRLDEAPYLPPKVWRSYIRSWRLAAKTEDWKRAQFALLGEKAIEELAASTSSSELSHFAGNRIDLERHFDTPENVSAYLFRRFKTGRGSIVRLFAGCDEGLRVWLNGKPVVRMRSSKLKYDAQAFEAKTKTGGNSLLVEVSNIKGEWEFCLRMEDQTGRPIAISPSGNLVVVE